MQILLAYATTIYDANCIVYYCFEIDMRRDAGGALKIKDQRTDTVRGITARLVAEKKTICTLKCAWDEVRRVTVRVLNERLDEPAFRADAGLANQQLPDDLRLHLAHELRKNISNLGRQVWFSIDDTFAPAAVAVQKVRDLYHTLVADTSNSHRFTPCKDPVPSPEDIHLILYSAARRAPLLTNDHNIYEFEQELRTAGLCEAIRPLDTVAPLA